MKIHMAVLLSIMRLINPKTSPAIPYKSKNNKPSGALISTAAAPTAA
jgi:hypothetical protein